MGEIRNGVMVLSFVKKHIFDFLDVDITYVGTFFRIIKDGADTVQTAPGVIGDSYQTCLEGFVFFVLRKVNGHVLEGFGSFEEYMRGGAQGFVL